MTPYQHQPDLPTPDYTSADGSVSLYCGDCLDILPKLPEGCVDAVVTDPPYGIKKGSAFVRSNCLVVDSGEQGGWNDAYSWSWLSGEAFLKPGGNLACFARREDTLPPPYREWHRYYIVKKSAPPTPRKVFVSAVEQCLIGSKPGGKRQWHGSGWELNYWYGLTPKRKNDGTQTGHPAEKPVQAIETLVRCLCGPEKVCIDPFMGSGTTGVACAKLGRRFIGVEKCERYFDIAVKRIEGAFADQDLFSGNQADEAVSDPALFPEVSA